MGDTSLTDPGEMQPGGWVEVSTVDENFQRDSRDPTRLPTVGKKPDGTFLTASHPDESEFLSKPEPLEESPPQEEYEPNFFDDDDEFDRILLYVLLAQEPSDLAPLRRWRFRRLALFFSLLDVSSLIVSILVYSTLTMENLVIPILLTFFLLTDLWGTPALYSSRVRVMSLFIILLFNRLILTLMFLPQLWLLITVPGVSGLLFMAYCVRQSYFGSWFPVVA